MKDLRSILQELFEQNIPGFKEKQKEFEILQIWPECVGEKIAKNTTPIKMIDNETLLIGTKSSSWAQELKFLEEDILNKLESKLGARRVKKLKFKLVTDL